MLSSIICTAIVSYCTCNCKHISCFFCQVTLANETRAAKCSIRYVQPVVIQATSVTNSKCCHCGSATLFFPCRKESNTINQNLMSCLMRLGTPSMSLLHYLLPLAWMWQNKGLMASPQNVLGCERRAGNMPPKSVPFDAVYDNVWKITTQKIITEALLSKTLISPVSPGHCLTSQQP